MNLLTLLKINNFKNKLPSLGFFVVFGSLLLFVLFFVWVLGPINSEKLFIEKAMGDKFFGDADYVSAIDHYERAIDYVDNDKLLLSGLHFNSAKAWGGLGEEEKAINSAVLALKANSGNLAVLEFLYGFIGAEDLYSDEFLNELGSEPILIDFYGDGWIGNDAIIVLFSDGLSSRAIQFYSTKSGTRGVVKINGETEYDVEVVDGPIVKDLSLLRGINVVEIDSYTTFTPKELDSVSTDIRALSFLITLL
jgi:tetratricopeptide (TPR) repeat protein